MVCMNSLLPIEGAYWTTSRFDRKGIAMKTMRVTFTAPGSIELQPFDQPVESCGADQVFMQLEHSVVSAGTELAILAGTEAGVKYPAVPGYGAVGRVIAAGTNVKNCHVGDRIFSYAGHMGIAEAQCMFIPVPEGMDGALAAFIRIGQVSITAVRIAQAELGDTVAVIGMGPVGNLAAQLFTLAGCDVIAIDRAEHRLELAQRCGIRHQLVAGADLKQRVADLTGGRMCRTVVEATGLAQVAVEAADLAGKLGEVILMGTPRTPYETDITPFLRNIHLWGNCVTYKGAHEWRFPIHHDWNGHSKHSLEDNLRLLLRLIADGRLHVKEFITHVMSPKDCRKAYLGLRDRKDEYLGVVFDWAQL